MSPSSERHFYEPRSGSGLPHSPFKSIVAPRPIGWISTRSTEGVLNLAPFSFFNAVNDRPPIIAFSCSGPKDTLRNAEETGEFCWNLVSAELADQMNETSAAVGPAVDEFARAGLSPADSRIVSAPHVARARAVFECRVSQILPLVDAAGSPATSTVVFGEVVGVHLDTALLVDGIFQTGEANPLLRAGGPGDYYTIRDADRRDMRRPRA